jgi:hypothetical protein
MSHPDLLWLGFIAVVRYHDDQAGICYRIGVSKSFREEEDYARICAHGEPLERSIGRELFTRRDGRGADM